MNEAQTRAYLAGMAFYRHREAIERALATYLDDYHVIEDTERYREAMRAYDEIVELDVPREDAA